MLKIIFTLDYEIHGNGDGSPYQLMVKPTYRILNLFNQYGAKLTIFADVAEILKFRDYLAGTGEDKFHYQAIVKQLQYAVKTGHDVQLHLHPSYFDAEFRQGKWRQNWSAYNLAELSYERLSEMIRLSKRFLEDTLKPSNPGYECRVFRAANWSMMPSRNIVKALIDNGFKIDTSVFKYGRRSGRVVFDYSAAYSSLIPWFIDVNDVNRKNDRGELLEVPIYSEQKRIVAFMSFIRLFRVVRALFHRHERPRDSAPKHKKSIFKKVCELFLKKHAWKLDFNQATGRQLIRTVKKIDSVFQPVKMDLPLVLIGHSKSFLAYNVYTLKPFLSYVKKNPVYSVALFSDLQPEYFRSNPGGS